MDKRLSGLAVLLVIAGLIGGILVFRGSDSEASSQLAAPTVVAASSTSTPALAASPIPGASPIVGELDCTGIKAWTDRVQPRFAETDAMVAKLQNKDDLEAMSVDDLNRLITLLETARADQQADVPPSAGSDVHFALLALAQMEIDFFTAARDAKTSGGDVGAVYDEQIGQMQTLAGGVSILAMKLAFACYDEFD